MSRRVRDLRRRERVDELIGLTDSPRWQTTAKALAALGDVGDVRALPAVVRHAGGGHGRVRLAAVTALGGIAAPESESVLKDQLLRSLQEDDRAVAIAAAGSLGRLGAEVPAELRGRLGTGPPGDLRAAVAETVVVHCLRELRAGPALRARLATLPVPESRIGRTSGLWNAVVAALGESGDPAAADQLVAVRPQAPPDGRAAIDLALLALGDRRGEAPLRTGEPLHPRYLRGIAARPPAGGHDALRGLLATETGTARIEVAIALQRLGDSAAADVLRTFLEHPDRRSSSPGLALSGLAVQARLALGDRLERRVAPQRRQPRGRE